MKIADLRFNYHSFDGEYDDLVKQIALKSYTSILSSMLTAQRLAPATKDVATLKKMNATVGYCRESFLKSCMINALGFNSANIKQYSSIHDYAKALKTGEIAGIFLEVPCAKVFLAQYCKSFMRTEKIFKDGGYGFINKAQKISENGKLLELEEKYISSMECAEPVVFSNEDASICVEWMHINCCSCHMEYVIRHIICSLNSTLEHNNLLKRLSSFTKRLTKYRRPSSPIVISIENPGNPHDTTYSEAMQPVTIKQLIQKALKIIWKLLTQIDNKVLSNHMECNTMVNEILEFQSSICIA
ncbi:hypothetical protein POM88_036829 [Heracleum sosnowskyi]|uniref:Uncharacterized protein n=1 Tax=Heracleum sosnowskyi TaxID=360622 RepID=A0AAD8HQY3_9APIA|nr:hypothetical protein POM88_036829 [Heracleum sosnowskyi]